MSTLESETLITLKEAAQACPGRPRSIVTMWQWCRHGCRGVYLESIVVGAQRFTSHEAMQRFTEATTAVAEQGARRISATNGNGPRPTQRKRNNRGGVIAEAQA